MELYIRGIERLNLTKKLIVSRETESCTLLDPKKIEHVTNLINLFKSEVQEEAGINALCDLAIHFCEYYDVDKIFLTDDNITFKSGESELSVKDFRDYYSIVYHLVDCYDSSRRCFYKQNKNVSRIIIVSSNNESSYEKIITTDKAGITTEWLVFKMPISGPTVFSDSSYLKFILKELFSSMVSSPDTVKMATKEVGNVDISKLNTIDLGDYIIMYDSVFDKYIRSAFSERLNQIGFEEDIKHGLTKKYEIKHSFKGDNNEDNSN